MYMWALRVAASILAIDIDASQDLAAEQAADVELQGKGTRQLDAVSLPPLCSCHEQTASCILQNKMVAVAAADCQKQCRHTGTELVNITSQQKNVLYTCV